MKNRLPNDKFISKNSMLYYGSDVTPLPTNKDISLWNTVSDIQHIKKVYNFNIPTMVSTGGNSAKYTCTQNLEYDGMLVYFTIYYRFTGTVHVLTGYSSEVSCSMSVLNATEIIRVYKVSPNETDITSVPECIIQSGWIKSNYGNEVRNWSVTALPSQYPATIVSTGFPLFTLTAYSSSSYNNCEHKLVL